MTGVIGTSLTLVFFLFLAPAIAGDTFQALSTNTPHETPPARAFPPSTMPVIADVSTEATFRAFSNMHVVELGRLALLPDDRLAAVQGKEMLAEGPVPMQIFNALFHALHSTTWVSSSTSTQSTSSVSRVQQNTGSGVQTNIIEIRQQ